MMPDLE